MQSFRREVLLLILFSYFFVGNNASKVCTGAVGIKWQPDSSDCSSFYICHGENGFRLPCPWNTVTNAKLEACVPRGSKMDTCTSRQNQVTDRLTLPPYFSRSTFQGTTKPASTTSTSRPPSTSQSSQNIPVSITSRPGLISKFTSQTKITSSAAKSTQNAQRPKWVTVPPQIGNSQNKCTPGSAEIILVSENCAKYINCSAHSGYKIEECPFPLLLDEVRRQCTDPNIAVCGKRPVSKDPCEYDKIPCQSGRASCRGRPDGFNPWRGNLISSSFVICENQRVIYKGRCPSSSTLTVFDPARKMCTELRMDGRAN